MVEDTFTTQAEFKHVAPAMPSKVDIAHHRRRDEAIFTIWAETICGNMGAVFHRFGQIYFAMWTNTLNLDKYILSSGQIFIIAERKIYLLCVRGNTFHRFGQICLSIWTNTFGNLHKYILLILQISIQSRGGRYIQCVGSEEEKERLLCATPLDNFFLRGQIHFDIWTNTFFQSYKYLLK